MDYLIIPLQEKLEDWKKALINLDKDHAKDYKRARSELKKRSTDTLRLQKKAKKGSKELQRRVECSIQDMTERKLFLEEIEKKAVRSALIEERSRFCLLVAFLKPVVDEEIAMLSELSHLQEVVDQLEKLSADPHTLPPASEQVINDLKSIEAWAVQSPPSSPGSLGSRKSSMCSISSLTSSSSGSSKSHHSPSHHHWHRSLSHATVTVPGRAVAPCFTSALSQDSGFTSQDTLFNSQFSNLKVSGGTVENNSNVSTPCGNGSSGGVISHPTSTWPNLQETLQFERAATAIINDRPHTISSAYERGHHRPPLTVYTFQAVQSCHSQPASPVGVSEAIGQSIGGMVSTRPPVPNRGSSLERPQVPKPRPHHPVTAALIQHSGLEITQPMYVNMHELASLAACKAQEMNFPPPPPSDSTSQLAIKQSEKIESNRDGNTSEPTYESTSGSGNATSVSQDDKTAVEGASGNGTLRNSLLRRGSVQGLKPPPPVRRTSSISVSGGAGTYGRIQGINQTSQSECHYSNNNLADTLPPPPPYLLESHQGNHIPGKVTKINNTSTVINSNTIDSRVTISEYQRTAAMGIAAEIQRKTAAQMPLVQALKETARPPSDTKPAGISVAETVRTLTELNHTPASPVSLRRTSGVNILGGGSTTATVSGPTSVPNISSGHPVNSIQHSASGNNKLNTNSTTTGGIVAALLSRQSSAREKFERDKDLDPRVAHDSLMDQIKRGTHLRKTSTVNDRSAPRIH